MLSTFRTKMKFWTQLILWPVIIAFVAFYGWSFIDARRNMTNVAAIVDGNKVSMDQVIRLRERLTQYYQNTYKENFAQLSKNMDFEQMALDQIIEEEILIQFAQESGIRVSNDEIRETIKTMPYFQREGQFSPKAYQAILNSMHMTPSMYENSLGRDLVINKIKSIISAPATSTIDELKESFERQNVKINCDAIIFKSADYSEKISLTDDEALAYFQAHSDEFKIGDQIKVDYIMLDPVQFEKDVKPTEDEIDDYYLENLDKFTDPEKVKASHILFKVDSNAAQEKWDEALAKAKDAKKRIDAGEDFATLAKALSDDTSAAAGGDLGEFTKGKMVKPFEEAAWNMEIDEISEPVKTDFGYHIIKKTGYVKGGVKPLEEIESNITSLIQKEKSKELAVEKAREFFTDVPENTKIQDLAQKHTLTVLTSEFFEIRMPPKEIGRGENLMSVLTELKKDEISIPVETNKGVFLFSLNDTLAAHIPEFAEVKEKAVSRAKNEKAVKEAEKYANEFLSDTKNGMSFEDASQKHNKTIESIGEMAKTGYIPKVGSDADFVNSLFTLNVGDISEIRKIQDKFVIMKVKSKKDFNEEMFNAELPKLRKQTFRNRQSQLTQAWVMNRKNQLLKDNKITVVMPQNDKQI